MFAYMTYNKNGPLYTISVFESYSEGDLKRRGSVNHTDADDLWEIADLILDGVEHIRVREKFLRPADETLTLREGAEQYTGIE